jgi:hypothetical protein
MKRLLALVLSLSFCPTTAFAQDKSRGGVDACIQASEDTQRERAKGHLRAARLRSTECLDARCPTRIRRDCDAQASELERLIPTIVFRVRAPDGSDITRASVHIDGAAESSALDGRAHEIDPGAHEITAAAEGYAAAHVRIVVEEGVRARVVELRPVPMMAEPSARAPLPEPAARSSAPAQSTWIASGALAGVGVIGLGLFAGLGLAADADFRHLRDTCGGACDARDADSVRTRFQVADIALGVGVVALATAVVVYFVGPRR